ncbi:hypothetical protein BX600DRAFT_459571 [Xylariales sp. PMI_506]|nr:hypothetical protein BX600DRAFT_459571 [Xylariales sp. PMI_506]
MLGEASDEIDQLSNWIFVPYWEKESVTSECINIFNHICSDSQWRNWSPEELRLSLLISPR